MTVEELSARLESVERANRRLRAGGIAAVVLVSAMATLGQAASAEKVVRAERLEVLDGEGRMRALLSTAKDGSPSLRLCDEQGKARVVVSVSSAGSAEFTFNDGKERVMGGLAATAKGELGLEMYDRADRLRVSLGTTEDGTPSLDLKNKDGNSTALLRVERDGGSLGLCDSRGFPRAILGGSDGGALLGLNGVDKRTRLLLCAYDKQAASLKLYEDLPPKLLENGDVDPEDESALRVSLGTVDGNGLLSLGRQGQGSQLVLATTSKGAGGIAVFDGTGASRLSAFVEESGAPYFSLSDEKGKKRAVLGSTSTRLPNDSIVTTPPSTLTLFDPNGKVLTQLPR